jgi:hypothetical protein
MLCTWNELREKYPNTLVLVEAKEARSEAGLRIVDSLLLIAVFEKDRDARAEYRRLHKESPQRELYIFPTLHEKLIIQEFVRVGLAIWPKK